MKKLLLSAVTTVFTLIAGVSEVSAIDVHKDNSNEKYIDYEAASLIADMFQTIRSLSAEFSQMANNTNGEFSQDLQNIATILNNSTESYATCAPLLDSARSELYKMLIIYSDKLQKKANIKEQIKQIKKLLVNIDTDYYGSNEIVETLLESLKNLKLAMLKFARAFR